MRCDLETALRGVVSHVFDVEAAEMAASTTIFGDLGATSLDFLELLYSLNLRLGTNLSPPDVAALLRGPLDDAAFADGDGRLTDEAREQIGRLMPELSSSDEPVYVGDVMSHLSIAHIHELLHAADVGDRGPRSACGRDG
jgi:acyl carrier protein